MDIRKLQRAIVDGLEDVKAQDIQVFDTEHLSPLFERVIIASGQSNRQTKALANSVRETVKERGFAVLRMEGEDNGEWIIVDCGAAVVHVMQPAIRQYYHLEEIWGEKSVRIQSAEAKAKAKKRQSALQKDKDDGASADTTAAKKAPAKRAPAKKAASSSGESSPVARKSTSATTGKTTRSGGTVKTKTVATKTSAATKSAKPAAKKTATAKSAATKSGKAASAPTKAAAKKTTTRSTPKA